MALSYTVVGPVTKRVTRNINKPDKDPKSQKGIRAPSDLVATAVSSSQINLTWTDNSPNEDGFEIERSLDGTSGWTQIATPAADTESASDTGLTPDTDYYYRVRAERNGKYSQWSAVASDRTDALQSSALSVEHVSYALNGTGLQVATINLTQGQDYTQCVPFITWHSTGTPGNNAYMSNRHVKVEMIDNSGTAAIRLTVRDQLVNKQFEIDVVEFDPAKVEVQQIAISGTTAATATATCSAVDLGKAFVLMYGAPTATNNSSAPNATNFLTRFSSTTQIEVSRFTTGAAWNGVAYVVEDIDGNIFDVQPFSVSTVAANTTADVTISSIDTAKTFVFATGGKGNTADYNHCTFTCRLQSATNVRIDKRNSYSGAVNFDVGGFAITFLDDTVVYRNASAPYTWTNTDTGAVVSRNVTVNGTFDPDTSIVCLGANPGSGLSHTYSRPSAGVITQGNALGSAKLNANGTQVTTAQWNGPAYPQSMSFDVIQFYGI